MRPLTFALLFLLAGPARASEFDTLFQNLKNTYQHADSWQANFTQTTTVELLGRNITKNGEMFLKKPGKLKIVYLGARPKMYVSNGQKLWIYTVGDSQMESYANVSSVVSRQALAFLQGLGELDRDFWVATPKGASAIKEFSLKSIELKPKTKNSPLKKIILGVDEKTGLVKETVLYNASGNQTHYLFKNIRLNPVLGDALFEFKKPAGVIEIRG